MFEFQYDWGWPHKYFGPLFYRLVCWEWHDHYSKILIGLLNVQIHLLQRVWAMYWQVSIHNVLHCINFYSFVNLCFILHCHHVTWPCDYKVVVNVEFNRICAYTSKTAAFLTSSITFLVSTKMCRLLIYSAKNCHLLQPSNTIYWNRKHIWNPNL